jgi:hypothetical protein
VNYPAPACGRERGAVLVLVLVLVAAGMAVSAAVAGTAALELAMAERTAMRLRAFEAAETGLATALRSREWSVVAPWTASGALAHGERWQVEMRLATVRLDEAAMPVEWHFEVHSTGRAGRASVALAQGFRVHGALPGEPEFSWWRRAEPPP